jgi:hypothetical protein
LSEIMDEHLYDDLVEQIREVSLEVKVCGYWKMFYCKAGMQYHVDLHANRWFHNYSRRLWSSTQTKRYFTQRA